VPFEPFERVSVGRTGLSMTRLGLGAAPLAGLYREVRDEDAIALIDHAWDIGIRSFDAAPLYGYGNGERRMGAALQQRPRDEFAFSTKVGRLAVPRDRIPRGADVDRQMQGSVEDAYYKGTPPVRMVFDYSYDGVMRSVEESLRRLGLPRVDILYIHDPDDHWEQAISGAWPALRRLRDEGVVKAVGAGMNQVPMLVRFARETDMDLFMVAGRYTLLDPSALDELMPLCVERGIGVVIAGVMNSGILADPGPNATFNYQPAPSEWVDRATRLREACAELGVPIKAAAVQFALAHPAVVSLIAGVRTIEHLDDYPDLMRTPIPASFWDELRARRLIPESAPVPAS
jgi:D-threo-aldose 1-dehydrogenase